MICADGVNFSDFIINWMDIPSSKEAFTPGRCDGCQFILSVRYFLILLLPELLSCIYILVLHFG